MPSVEAPGSREQNHTRRKASSAPVSHASCYKSEMWNLSYAVERYDIFCPACNCCFVDFHEYQVNNLASVLLK